MKQVPLFELPFASTDAYEPDLRLRGDLILRFVVPEADTWELRFVNTRAFCKRAESHCTLWHIEHAYDTVCEVKDSRWVRELWAESSDEGRRWTMNHYILTVDSWGSIEVVAESVSDPARIDIANPS